MVVKNFYWHGHVSFFCQKIPGKKICSTAARRSQKMLFAFSKKPFFRFAIFVPAVASGSLWLSPADCFFRLAISLYKNKPGGGYWFCSTLFKPDAEQDDPPPHWVPVAPARSLSVRACGSSQGKGARLILL